MSFAIGMKLGPYQIQSLLGAGGMGEVYRARDTRLSRDVAIKVLPESLAHDTERLQRFKHEARVLGALNHPNLLAIYDIGEEQGRHYLVSEYLDGGNLRDRLSEVPLSQRQVLEFSVSIAKGLAAAHDKGIVHRDLKPENILITKNEQVKVLDFGLAKSLVQLGQSDPTVTLDNQREHTNRNCNGHGRLYVAGTSAGSASRPTVRHLQLRGGSLRDVDRTPGLSEGNSCRDNGCDS